MCCPIIQLKIWERQSATELNININIIHRTYFTPERLHKINESISYFCPRCKIETGDLIHMFWKCNTLNHYWGSICETLKKIAGFEIPCSPKLALQGDISDIPLARRNKVRFIKLAMIAGNKCIALLRKSSDPPTVSS